MSTETGKSSTESEVVSALDYEETELTLGLGLGPPGAAAAARSEPERKRSFPETESVGLSLGGGSRSGAARGGDLTADSSKGRALNPSRPPAAK